MLGPRVVTISEVAASAAAGFRLGPFVNSYTRNQFVGAILRSKNRSLALFHVLPIFAKRGNEIPLVRN